MSDPQKGVFHASGVAHTPETSSITPLSPISPYQEQTGVLAETLQLNDTTDISSGAEQGPLLSPGSSIEDVTVRLEETLQRQMGTTVTDDNHVDDRVPSALISRDIELTTTMDLLTAGEVPLQPSVLFFVEAVECPWITPYDGVNWEKVKIEVADVGMSNKSVGLAIMAISALYKAQLNNLPMSKALSLYHRSRAWYQKHLSNQSQDFGTILIITILLCLFETIHYETAPVLRELHDIFVGRLESWAQQNPPHSEQSLRIIAWLRLLHTATIRGGGRGIIPDSIVTGLRYFDGGVSNLSLPSSHQSDMSTHVYEMLSAPIFKFYYQLQVISGEICKLTHYHRSRTTAVDQDEVAQQLTQVRLRLHLLWESRPATQRQTPEELRSHLGLKIADPLTTLIGACTAAYHAEFIEMGRVLGDPVSKSTETKQAMRQIRGFVDGDWNAYDGSKLNSGYLRPLFLYAIECMDPEENRWAVERLRHVQNPVCRSDFWASFGEALFHAQLQKERRVTSKYFCTWYFGVPPPFI
ncbi:hypothetical protein A1O3_06980 [Capronia epimyces CBS 606.96]|uniref:Transcription factor domain-containing protein n=1 Tax=Capronia epimyces CBS 606.96 TaxID=1182542 RepID=W9XUK9_9EURO|nr:uncharacterized protein A1O3_06980 [Capronia epimyces CBS 606.96]EXJ80696.1 hypothetical protein A1O3_06980 [Capronia epimyces CBS 606.96]